MDNLISEHLVVNEKCKLEISKTFAQFRNLAFIYILWSFVSGCRYIYMLVITLPKPYTTWRSIFNLKIYPVMYVAIMSLGILNTYYCLKAYSMQKKAVELSDETLFAESYVLFRKGILTAIIIAVISFIATGFFYQLTGF